MYPSQKKYDFKLYFIIEISLKSQTKSSLIEKFGQANDIDIWFADIREAKHI